MIRFCFRQLAVVFFLFATATMFAQTTSTNLPGVLSIRDQEQFVLEITQKRFDVLLPEMMEKTGIDMWVISCNEDDLDPIFETMLPLHGYAPITQILVFYLRGPGDVERINISRTNLGELFSQPWDRRAFDRGEGESQWKCFGRIVRERNPGKIGVNIGDIQWAAGGLTVPLAQKIQEAIGGEYSERLISAEPLATLWGMTLLEEEIKMMEQAVALSKAIIAEIFSNRVITPQITTTDDLHYYYRERVAGLGLGLSFSPYFRIRGRNQENTQKYGVENVDIVIRPGDLIMCDVGLKYMRYNTDNKAWAYVLKVGETVAPEEFRQLMGYSGKLQEIFCGELQAGLTGNQVLSNILKRANEREIPGPRVYSHSVGYFTHQPGPLIGLPWEQVGVKGRGDVKLEYNSCYTLEISVGMPIEKLGGRFLDFATEEVILFSEKGTYFLDGRQSDFFLVR